jgi:signal transduction histidine kinase
MPGESAVHGTDVRGEHYSRCNALQQSIEAIPPHMTEHMQEPQERHLEPALARLKNLMENSDEPREGTKEDFGEVLRHELNNPLTGILGNAELLLAEIRRGDGGRIPPGGVQRLETIAALAVRLRETIRRLSQKWELRDAELRKKPEAP